MGLISKSDEHSYKKSRIARKQTKPSLDSLPIFGHVCMGKPSGIYLYQKVMKTPGFTRKPGVSLELVT